MQWLCRRLEVLTLKQWGTEWKSDIGATAEKVQRAQVFITNGCPFNKNRFLFRVPAPHLPTPPPRKDNKSGPPTSALKMRMCSHGSVSLTGVVTSSRHFSPLMRAYVYVPVSMW